MHFTLAVMLYSCFFCCFCLVVSISLLVLWVLLNVTNKFCHIFVLFCFKLYNNVDIVFSVISRYKWYSLDFLLVFGLFFLFYDLRFTIYDLRFTIYDYVVVFLLFGKK